jgi:(1->4)-alpha-D-glucan 1-alpha-D-glucosylmutase
MVRRVERPDADPAEVRLAGRARPVSGQRAHRPEFGADLPARVQSLAGAPHDGSAKLWFIWRMLSLRREHAELFRDGSYEGLAVEGPLARHVVAFARRHEGRTLVVIAGRLFAGIPSGGAEGGAPALPDVAAWRGTRVVLPDGLGSAKLANVLTGEALVADGNVVPLEGAFCWMPWAAFIQIAEPSA